MRKDSMYKIPTKHQTTTKSEKKRKYLYKFRPQKGSLNVTVIMKNKSTIAKKQLRSPEKKTDELREETNLNAEIPPRREIN